MSKEHFFKPGNLLKYISLFITIVLLSYCTTTPHETASSFSKRKYTKGHFSDPVAKAKTGYNPGINFSIAPPIGSPEEKRINPNSHQEVFSKSTSDAERGRNANSKQTQSGHIAISKSPLASGNENVSLSYNTPGNPEHGYNDHVYQHNDGSNSSGLLIAWLICLAVAIICFLIVFGIFTGGAFVGGISSGSIEGGCFLYFFGFMAGIASLVLFILWVVAISR